MNRNLYIIWDDSSNFGIPIIDEQHRGLISTINSLYYFIHDGQGNEIIKSVLIMLGQYVNIHFKVEERLMEKAGYPGLKDHITLHKNLTKKTKNLFIDIENEGITDEVLRFLKMWWLNHITIEDAKYKDFVKKLLD